MDLVSRQSHLISNNEQVFTSQITRGQVDILYAGWILEQITICTSRYYLEGKNTLDSYMVESSRDWDANAAKFRIAMRGHIADVSLIPGLCSMGGLIWNCTGLGEIAFAKDASSLHDSFSPTCWIITGTHPAPSTLTKHLGPLGFKKSTHMAVNEAQPNDLTWIIWNEELVTVTNEGRLDLTAVRLSVMRLNHDALCTLAALLIKNRGLFNSIIQAQDTTNNAGEAQQAVTNAVAGTVMDEEIMEI